MEFIQEQLLEIKQLLEKQRVQQNEFLTVDEIADYLQLSKSAIYKITSKKEITFYNPGGKKIYFKKIEVDAWIEEGRVASDSEILEQFNNSTTF